MSRTGFALRLFALAAAVFWLAFNPAAAQTDPAPEKRIALVIGNSNYEAVKALPNPANDAKAVAQLFNQAGFEVVMAFDLTRDLMRQVVAEFAAKVAEKGPNSVALVYYAGHGLQVDGDNFLVPVDARFEKEADVAEQGVRLADVMATLEAVPSKTRIVILDACRNNPFSAIGDVAGKGLAIVDAPSGTIVAYSTAPGTEAFDGAGQHSPYTAAFIRTVKQPNLPIEQLFKKVRVLVDDVTGSKQMPWESSSLTSDFVFFSNANADVAAESAPRLQVAELRTRSVQDAYHAVVAEDSVEYYEEFVRIYPTHPLCDHIRRALSRRLQMIAWHKATKSNSAQAYQAFLSKHGNSDLANAAKKLQERPKLVSLFPKSDIKIGNIGSKTGPVIPFPKNGNGQNGNNQNGNNQNGNNQNGNTGIGGGIKTGPIVKPSGPVNPLPQNGQNGSANGTTNGQATTLPKPNGNVIKLPADGQVVTLPKPGEGTVVKKDGVITKLPEAGKVTTLPVKTGRPVIKQTGTNGNIGIIKNQNVQVKPKLNNNVQIRRDIAIQRKPVERQNAGNFNGQFRR